MREPVTFGHFFFLLVSFFTVCFSPELATSDEVEAQPESDNATDAMIITESFLIEIILLLPLY
jgi:hypothetical protein